MTGGYNAVFVGDKRLQWDTEVTAARPLSPTGYKAGTSCLGRLERQAVATATGVILVNEVLVVGESVVTV